jgi:transporter family-2 protein
VLLVAVAVFARGVAEGRDLGAAPWWVWIGGFLGAFYVLGSVVTAPRLGAAVLFAFILAGQAIASLAVDHFGWVGFEKSPITAGRLAGVVLVAAGVALVRVA